MLARRKVELDIMMVSCLTHPDLVRRMAEEGVKGVSRDVEQLMLYRLVNVPRILNLFMVTKDRQRMAAVTSAVQQFDPVSQFWVGELVVTADLVLFILRSILTVRFGYLGAIPFNLPDHIKCSVESEQMKINSLTPMRMEVRHSANF